MSTLVLFPLTGLWKIFNESGRAKKFRHDITMGIRKKTKSYFRLSDPVIPINNELSLSGSRCLNVIIIIFRPACKSPQLSSRFAVQEQMALFRQCPISLRMFTPIVSAHPYCPRNSHAMSCIKCARSIKANNNKANDHSYNFVWI